MSMFAIGSHTFRSKQDAIACVRNVLYRSAPGIPLAGEDADLLRQILANHPDPAKATLLNLPITTFVNATYGRARGFCAVHPSGETTSFTYRVAFEDPTTRLRQKARHAARRAVVPSIIAFKQTVFVSPDAVVPCAVTGEPLSYHACHVDHHPTSFAKIFEAFCVLGVPNTTDDDAGAVFSPSDASRFRAFHDERASLRVVSPSANLSRR